VLVHVRVGVNSGEVVVRSVGSDLRMDYTAVGQTTHLAARMEQMAMPGSILITAGTLRLAEGYVEVDPLGPVALDHLEFLPECRDIRLDRHSPPFLRLLSREAHVCHVTEEGSDVSPTTRLGLERFCQGSSDAPCRVQDIRPTTDPRKQ
jgi:class 3 adenylate cyclase